jgi:nucleoside 2-deoxyribosyltransferase
MLDKRYQVFISTSGKDMQPERMTLSQTLVGMGFFSWGLEQRTPLSTAFARRQIDDCDYVVILLGSQYGEQSVSGVGYMHLEYIYAVTKQKPIIVFMHDDPDSRDVSLHDEKPELKAKFKEFRKLLQNEVDQVFTYRSLRDLELAVRSNMSQMLERYPVQGWVRPQNTQALHDEIDRLKNKLVQLETESGKRQIDPFLTIPKVSMHENFSFEYRMHAYQDGNFKELKINKTLTWAQLLSILGNHFTNPTPEEFFTKGVNDYLNETGLEDARNEMPRAHAVARSQINIRALHNIKMQMRQNEWIVPNGRDDRQRLLWQLTSKGQKLLESNLLDNDRVFQFRAPH